MKVLPILILILFLFAPVFVLAVSYSPDPGSNRWIVGCDPEVPCTCRGENQDLYYPIYCVTSCRELWDNEQLCSFKFCCALARIQHFLFFIASGLAVVIIVWAGIMYMVAGGEERANKAKKILLYGLIGAAIVFGSSFIINMLMEIIY